MPHRLLDHTGDTAIEVSANTEEELMVESTRALSSVIIDTEAGEAPRLAQSRAIELEAEDGESLLVDFLNELIFFFDSEGFLGYDLEIDELSLGSPAVLRANVRGEKFDPERQVFLTEVKAATFHGVRIEREPAGLRAVVVLDL